MNELNQNQPNMGNNKLSLATLIYPTQVAQAKNHNIAEKLMRFSNHVKEVNYKIISDRDLILLYDFYDQEFFDGKLRQLVQERADGKLSFRFSKRMNRAGGKTTCVQPRTNDPIASRAGTAFEIAISSTLLYTTFGDIERPVMVCGKICDNRLQALQRIFEHELIHLLEMLIWQKSQCAAERFQTLAYNIFAHTGVTHDLITQTEVARINYDIKVGDRVKFTHEGKIYIGHVNRITRRATILVEHPNGMPYTNGHRYLKFYVPLPQLERIG